MRLILIFVILLLIYIIFTTHVSEFGSLNNMGNILCDYFYYMGYSWSKNEEFIWQRPRDDGFYKHLPKRISKPEGASIVWVDGNPGGGIVDFTWPVMPEFWKSMQPHISKILDEALQKENLKPSDPKPVLHFRCSDVPFNKWPGYVLAKYAFYSRCGFGNYVEIVSCNTHLANEHESSSCKKYITLLQEKLKEIGITSVHTCGTIEQDFAKMFYAPILANSSSSMSFFAGMSNGKFITPTKEELLQHEEVDDYHNVQLVHSQLSA